VCGWGEGERERENPWCVPFSEVDESMQLYRGPARHLGISMSII
jgi:hypothetical protein